MHDDERHGPLDAAVAALARLMTAVGLNGNRLLWKWRRRKQALAEARVRTEVMLRSAKGRHKMCRACRALVPRGAGTCPECGETLAGVSAPGVTRLLTNMLPTRGLVVGLLVLINGLLYILTMMSPVPDDVAQGGSSLMSISWYNLVRYGGGLGLLIFQNGEWWRWITPMFLHAGLLHIGMNMLVLVRLGPIVEELYGPTRFWCLYIGSGIAGNLLATLLNARANVIGASTALAGLIGVMLAFGMRRKGSSGAQIRSVMLQNALFLLVISLLPQISFWGHAGGFAGGLGLGLIVPADRPRGQREGAWQLIAVVLIVLVLIAFYQMAVHGGDFARDY